jgi:hypothetical protein
MQWPGTEFARSPLFADVREVTIERRAAMDAAEYVGHLSTVSAYLQLPAHRREQVLARILKVLPERVTVSADVTVHLARSTDLGRGPGYTSAPVP